MEDNREIEIDLRKIFTMLKKKIIFIILFGLIGAALAGCFTNLFIEPKYTASVQLYVNSNNSNLIGSSGSISSGEYDASEKLVGTYIVVVESRTFLEKVAEEMDETVSASAIQGMMSCSQIDETLAFKVSITSTDPNLAAEIANTIADTCPDEIVRVLKVGGVETIDYAVVPTSPSSPNLEQNILIGFIVGFALSLIIYFIKELFDTRILSEKDLERDFNIPVLGTIPRLLPVESSETDDTKKSSSSDKTLHSANKESK
ncbi:MAG: hypothetical protein LIO62_03950 [Clostridiales bacterium]|nr:hypothetical protein [Clostridiales bacterium]